jgi:succinyl-diaminopimelate desuccinylase
MTSSPREAGQDETTRSVVRLAQELVRRSSRGGIDDYGPVLGVLEEWLTARAVPHRRLCDEAGALVGLLVEVAGGRPGAWWTLDACVDTAPYGDSARWSFHPTCGQERDGWLLGRGAADSKLAAAMYCHIAAGLAARRHAFAGGLAVLLDVDEHTGNFGGARAYLADPHAARPAGVVIGYPGMDEVVVGGRGLWRATINVHAPSGHSGSSRTVTAPSPAPRVWWACSMLPSCRALMAPPGSRSGRSSPSPPSTAGRASP